MSARGSLQAQDVTTGAAVSFRPLGDSDRRGLTVFNLKPRFPEQLKTMLEPGYAIAAQYAGPEASIHERSVHATHSLFERVTAAALPNWVITNARQNRKRVPAHVWVSVIFNPKSAAEKIPDATPRLLAVAPVQVPVRLGMTEPFTVRVGFTLDETGAIQGYVPVTPLVEADRQVFEASLKSWRFAPARKNNRAVASTLTMRVLFEPTPDDFLKRTPPLLLNRTTTAGYPAEMHWSGIQGEVVIRFGVDETGTIQKPEIVWSSHSGFERAALATMRMRKYAPATTDGRPVSAEGLRAHFHYWVIGGGEEGVRLFTNIDQAKLPSGLRYDHPGAIRGVVAPVYPYALRRDNVRGAARATIAIDDEGRMTAIKIVEADRPEFGLAVASALAAFTFDPAYREGKPVPFLLTYKHDFARQHFPQDNSDALLRWEKTAPAKILSSTALDVPLTTIARRDPIFPLMAPENVTSGEARVEFLVDEAGQVRLPRIVSASRDEFGYAATQAVSRWQYEPPKKGGKPVVVRVEQAFSFMTPWQRDAARE